MSGVEDASINACCDGKALEIIKEDAELEKDDTLEISIELDPADEDIGETLTVNKMRIGEFDDKGLKICGGSQ